MREILFRGKSINDNEWVFGDLIRNLIYDGREKEMRIGDIYFEHNGDIHGTAVYKVIPETVGQFTGLTDKNGKKIFEGDVVKVKHTIQNRSKEDLSKTPRRGYGAKVVDGSWCDFNLEYFRNYEVVFKTDSQRLMIKNKQDHHYLCDTFVRYHEVEVIGNIHDNPELLEKL